MASNTRIQLKKSNTPGSVPTSANLAHGELAINLADGKLFYKNTTNHVVEFSPQQTIPDSFGTVNANSTLIIADTQSDILTLIAGNNVSIVGDAINDTITIGLKDDVAISGLLSITASSGDEGGEIRLANAVTNSLLAGPVNIDIYQNKLRFFVSGGDARGAFINLASTSAGVGTDLLAAASATDTTARNLASEAFDKANAANVLAFNALPNTNGVTFNGTLTASSNLVADRIISTNNGNGENYKVGDDAWIGDFNIANAIRIKGQQNTQHGYVSFGTQDSKLLGRAGTDDLTWDSNKIWHAGNDGTGSTLDADLLDGQHGSYYGIASDVAAAFNKANTANITADLAFDKANAANVLAFNTGIGANLYATTITNANLILAYAQANTIGNASNNYATIINNANLVLSYAQSNTVGDAANTYATTITNANLVSAYTQANTVGDAANSYTNLSVQSANIFANATFVKLSSSITQTITSNLDIVGNLTLSGNTIFLDATRLEIDDPLIYLAGNNYISDIVDIGFIANYVNATGQNVHTGLYREHEDKEYYLFQGYDKEPTNNHLGALSNNMTLAVLNAQIRTSNLILGGANAILAIAAGNNWTNSQFDSANTRFLSNSSANYTYTGNLIVTASGSAGNVLIGTTVGSSVADRIKLNINGGANAAHWYDDGVLVQAISNSYATSASIGANGWANLIFQYANNTSLTNTSPNYTYTGNLIVTAAGSAGNVLIGTTSGSSIADRIKLNVNGAINAAAMYTQSNVVTFGTAMKIDANGQLSIFGNVNML